MKRPKIYRVRIIKVWEENWTALTREEALEKSEQYHTDAGYDAEDYNRVTAKVLMEASARESIDYWNDTLPEEE